MKKGIAILLIVVVVLGAVGVGCSMNRSDPVSENVSQMAQAPVASIASEVPTQNAEQPLPANEPVAAPPAEREITLEDAKGIALEDAGITEEETSRLHGRLDYDDGRKVYDVEFYNGNTEYDYEILADSGEIFERNIETHAAPPSQADGIEQISVEQAKENAAGHAAVTLSEANFTEARLERDDGREVYEIEFSAGGRRYEYVVDSYTGEILEAEID